MAANTSDATPGAAATTPSVPNTKNDDDNSDKDKKRQNNPSNAVQLSNPKNYEGNIPEVRAILALQFEKFDKKVPFQLFVEKVSTYTYSNLKNGGNMLPLFKLLKDPLISYDSKTKPSALSSDKKDDELEKDIYK